MSCSFYFEIQSRSQFHILFQILPQFIMGGTDMLILHTTTTSTPIGVHRGAMHGDPRHAPEDRAS